VNRLPAVGSVDEQLSLFADQVPAVTSPWGNIDHRKGSKRQTSTCALKFENSPESFLKLEVVCRFLLGFYVQSCSVVFKESPGLHMIAYQPLKILAQNHPDQDWWTTP
jgi:hypothetical protein